MIVHSKIQHGNADWNSPVEPSTQRMTFMSALTDAHNATSDVRDAVQQLRNRLCGESGSADGEGATKPVSPGLLGSVQDHAFGILSMLAEVNGLLRDINDRLP